jgi:hypothetical protein
MNIYPRILLIFCALSLFSPISFAQNNERIPLAWNQRVVQIGPVLEERGEALVEFKGKNISQKPLFITEVITDCGCTTVDYSTDTLQPGEMATLKVKFDSENKGGLFKKNIIVKTSLDEVGDSLRFEGQHFPLVESPENTYVARQGDLGMRLATINFGDVFDNQPKVKYVEIYNFGNKPVDFSSLKNNFPKHLGLKISPQVIAPHQRAILEIDYDGKVKNDLGFFDETLNLEDISGKKLKLHLVANVLEYYPPLPKSRLNEVAKLGISEAEIDLREISSNQVIERSILLSNLGNEPLQIKKIITNCDCVTTQLAVKILQPGETSRMTFSFNPKGRKGIDHRNITIFSNDPLNPVRTLVIRSSVK